MKWKLKKSTAKSAKPVCVLRINKNNLTGDFMVLSNLGNNEYSYSPQSVGIYRIMHNVDKSAKPIEGCVLVYNLDGEHYLRFLSVPDEQVKAIPDESLLDSDYINSVAIEIRSQY